ncbi:MAG: N-acetyl-gamma-glutamyl-phosphate reductase [Elusimicrobiota bacterium]|nr:N-acetyl-gamma-glutamyl-phosphate reductase [Elusimicrobiota bacterium]
MKIGIIGASGYTGVELLRLLHNHPKAEVVYLTSQSNDSKPASLIYPHLDSLYEHNFVTLDDVVKNISSLDLIFTALPHGHAMAIGKLIAGGTTRLIDIGADYRFKDYKIYEEWYKVEHTHKDHLAVYGLSELNYEQIKTAQIVANPGCYPTASILALYPLIKNGLIENSTIIVDAASGTSGAGKALKNSYLFSEVFENFSPYGVTTHRHTPEIEEFLSLAAGERITITFTPHLVPMTRGILATCYAKLKPEVDEAKIAAAFKDYDNKHFIRVKKATPPSTKNTRGSNYADIGWFIDERTGRIIVFCAIDNLVKGASGQAIQNMNIMFGLDEKMGLELGPVYP